jgi:F-type H+-transporting ATPase subunit b
MNRVWRMVRYTGVLAILSSFAPGAFAAEESGSYPSDPTGGIFLWINFLILVAGIVWVVRVHGRPFFRTNAERISQAIAKAAGNKLQAEQQLREAEARLGRLDQEVAELRAEAMRETSLEAGRIRAMAELEARRIGEAARAEIQAAERAARLELKAIAAKLAVDGAESLLKKQLTPQRQEALILDFMRSLPGRPN